MHKDRITKMLYRMDGKKYYIVQLREKWMDYLKQKIQGTNEKTKSMTEMKKYYLLKYFNETTLKISELDDIIIYNSKYIEKQ